MEIVQKKCYTLKPISQMSFNLFAVKDVMLWCGNKKKKSLLKGNMVAWRLLSSNIKSIWHVPPDQSYDWVSWNTLPSFSDLRKENTLFFLAELKTMTYWVIV